LVNEGGQSAPTISELVNHPLSKNFKAPPARTPKELVNWMVALQVKTYGRATTIPLPGLLKNMKALLVKYGIDRVQRGIALAGFVSNYPFSTALVEKLILDMQEDGYRQE